MILIYAYNQTQDGNLNENDLSLSLYNNGLSATLENDVDNSIFKIHSNDQSFNQNQIEIIDNLVASHIGSKPLLRIFSLIDPQFAGFMPHKVDFRKHLLPNIHIQKDVEMLLNGRPDYAIYKYNNENIARIRFEFELNAFFLMTRRKEILGYYNSNDEILEEYIVSDEIYDLNNSSYHLTKSMSERSECRTYVMENMKAILNGFILNYYLALQQEFMSVLSLVSLFFKKYSDSFTTWMQTGAGDFKQMALNDDEFSFLDLSMIGLYNGTVRDYIIMRIENA